MRLQRVETRADPIHRVEHPNFEFTLGLEVRRDGHIIQMLHNSVPKIMPAVRPIDTDAVSFASTFKSGGLRGFFGSPRKKGKIESTSKPLPETPPKVRQVVQQPQEPTLVHYFAPGESVVGKTHIAFKPIAKNCDSRLLEIRYPMFGNVRQPAAVSVAKAQESGRPSSQPNAGSEASTPAVRKQVCKVTLQMFRLPPLPGLTQEQLPQSIDECLRGMRHHAWHEHEYHEGLLTQKGGDSIVSPMSMFPVTFACLSN